MYKENTIINKLKNALKKDPILIFTEPIGRIISSHTALSLENAARKIGKIISLTTDCTKFREAKLTIKATDIATILYSLRNLMKFSKTTIISFLEVNIYKIY